MKYLFLNIQTIGFHDKLEITDKELEALGKEQKEVQIIEEISYILCDKDLNVLEKMNDYCKTDIEPTTESMEINKITSEMLENASDIKETLTCKKINKLLKDEPVIVSHNIKYIMEVLKNEKIFDLENYNYIDTLQLAKKYSAASYKRLSYLYYYYKLYKNIDLKFSQTNSYSLLLNEKVVLLLEKMKELYSLNLEELPFISETLIELKSMPYGKHKGIPISKLENNYIIYFIKKDIEDKNLEYTLLKEIMKRGGLKKILSELSIYQIENLLKEEKDLSLDFLTTLKSVYKEKQEKELYFKYGKHEGKHIKDVLAKDPGYIDFMEKNKKLNKYQINYIS